MTEEGLADVPGAALTAYYADAWALDQIPGPFDAALSTFFVSHLPRRRLPDFVDALDLRVGRAGRVLLADNVYLEGVGGELVRREGQTDTWKKRTLADGTSHEILKNYFSAEELAALVERRSSRHDLVYGHCFWWIAYHVR